MGWIIPQSYLDQNDLILELRAKLSEAEARAERAEAVCAERQRLAANLIHNAVQSLKPDPSPEHGPTMIPSGVVVTDEDYLALCADYALPNPGSRLLERLTAAERLHDYTYHRPTCDKPHGGNCTCGLNAALTAFQATKEGK